jgi:hypothetical protein
MTVEIEMQAPIDDLQPSSEVRSRKGLFVVGDF